jgi:hypothetical protein
MQQKYHSNLASSTLNIKNKKIIQDFWEILKVYFTNKNTP